MPLVLLLLYEYVLSVLFQLFPLHIFHQPKPYSIQSFTQLEHSTSLSTWPQVTRLSSVV